MARSGSVTDHVVQPCVKAAVGQRALRARCCVCARPQHREAATDDELSHPLLGDQPTLKLMPDPNEVQGFANGGPRAGARSSRKANWLLQLVGWGQHPHPHHDQVRAAP